MRIVRIVSGALIPRMDYGDVRGVQLEKDSSTGVRTLSWYVEIADHKTWEKHTLVLLPGETHPMVDMWRTALRIHGDRSRDAGSDRPGISQKILRAD